MNKQFLSKALIYSGIFILGVTFHSAITPSPEDFKTPDIVPVPTMPVEATQAAAPISCEPSECTNEFSRDEVMRLLAVDNEGIGYCAEYALSSSRAFNAASEFDVEGITKEAEVMKKINQKTEDWGNRRSALIRELGLE